MIIYIYKLTNKITGLSYIGQSNNPKKRFNQHCNLKKSSNYYITNSIQKHGREVFLLEILDKTATRNDANKLERFYIENQNTLAPHGYNLKMDEYSERLPETKERIRQKALGRIPSPETKKLWKEQRKGSGNSMYGKNHSKETKKKIAQTKYTQPIIGIKGSTTLYFPYITACKDYPLEKINPGGVYQCLKGIYKQHKGYKWYYLKDFKEL